MMRKQIRIMLWLCFLGVIALSGFVILDHIVAPDDNRCVRSWGLDELSHGSLTLYVSESGVYRLDPDQAKWTLVGKYYSGHNKQDVAIVDIEAFFCRHEGIYKINIHGDELAPKLLADIDYSPDMLAISWNGHFIAYRKYMDDMFRRQAVVIRDIQSGEEKSFEVAERPDSICWSIDDSALFMGNGGRIVKLLLSSGRQEPICEGYSVQTLLDGDLCYSRGSDTTGQSLLLFRRNMDTGVETEIARVPVAGFTAATLDPEGRFLAVGYITPRGLISFDFRTSIELIDTQTGRRCWLPHFDRVTRCILWQSNKLAGTIPAAL